MPDITLGQVDYSDFVFILDPAQTDGSGKTGLVAANLTVSYARMETDNDATVTDVTSSLSDLAALTTAHTDWGLKEISSTLAPGLYRLDVADAVFASGAWSAVVYVMITTSAAAPSPIRYNLIAWNPLDAVRLGITALPNAAAEAAGGLYTRGTGAGQLSQSANGELGIATLTKTLTTYTGNTVQTGDSFARIGANGVSLSAIPDLAGVTTLLSRLSAVRAGYLDNLSAGAVALEASLQGLITTIGASAAGVASAVWGAGTRLLTAGTNIVLAKGTGVTGFNDPTVGAIADQVWDEAIAGHVGAGSTGEALTDAGGAGTPPTAVEIADEVETRAMTLTSGERSAIAAALLDLSNAIETGVTLRGSQRLMLAVLAGKLSGAGTGTITFRNAVADSKDRIVQTGTGGNRVTVTTDQT